MSGRSLNILHLNDQRGWRGGEQQAAYLIARTPAYGHRVFLAGRRGAPLLEADFGGVESGRYAFPFRGELDIITAWRIARLCRRMSIDVVHAHTSHAHMAALFVRSLFPRVKVVVSRRVVFRPRSGAVNRWKYSAPDATIAISRRIAEILRDYRLADEAVYIVPSGIDPKRMDVAPLPRVELGLPDHVPLLVNVAALVDEKDHATLLRSLPGVLDRYPDAHLLIAGDGPLRAELERLAAGLGIASSVHFLGHRDDVPAILRAADLFVFSSKEEGLGTSVLDAMAARVPVVATAAGGIPEMIRDGETGYLAPAQDPNALAARILHALDAPASLAPLVAAAHALVTTRYSVDAMVAGNIRVYESLFSDTDTD